MMCFFRYKMRKARREEARWRASGAFLERFFQPTQFRRDLFIRYADRCFRIARGKSPWKELK